MTDLDAILHRHTRRGDVCSLCGLGWPCDATQLADELIELRETVSLQNEILEKALHDDVDVSMTAGLIQLRGDSRVLADLPGDRANILRGMLDDLIGERDSIAESGQSGQKPMSARDSGCEDEETS